ncbi:conditioned medium-induced protein 4 [Halorutilales archaeon Cl-col2-1]
MSESDNTSDKTEELRDLFVEVTDESTVTEEKKESHGTLKDEEEINEEIEGTVEEMLDRYGIDTKLDTDDLVELVRLYHDGYSDTEIARDLGDEKLNKTVARTRVKLHLFRESDFDPPFDIDRLREFVDDDLTTAEMADELDVSKSTVRSYVHVIEAENEADRANHKYQDRFKNLLEDREISERITSSATEDGLQEATEGLEVDVDM